MSNEYKDWLADQKAENEWWVNHYPFLRIENNAICPWNKIDSCWLNDIPAGWVMAFGKQMCDELTSVLGEYVTEFHILQMKEKYSHLVVYWTLGDFDSNFDEEITKELNDNIEKVLSKYYDLSYHTCWICGKQATEFTNHGCIASYCKDCFDRQR